MWHKGRNRSKAGAASIELLIVGSFVSIVEDIMSKDTGLVSTAAAQLRRRHPIVARLSASAGGAASNHTFTSIQLN
jgi:hypothetical protein